VGRFKEDDLMAMFPSRKTLDGLSNNGLPMQTDMRLKSQFQTNQTNPLEN